MGHRWYYHGSRSVYWCGSVSLRKGPTKIRLYPPLSGKVLKKWFHSSGFGPDGRSTKGDDPLFGRVNPSFTPGTSRRSCPCLPFLHVRVVTPGPKSETPGVVPGPRLRRRPNSKTVTVGTSRRTESWWPFPFLEKKLSVQGSPSKFEDLPFTFILEVKDK